MRPDPSYNPAIESVEERSDVGTFVVLAPSPRISLGRSNYYGDNRSVDGYGLDVDVVLPEVDTLKSEQMRELAEVVARL
jgi:hypothetical protein